MCKSDYSIEDFVLDPEFKKWVLNPDSETKIYWEEFLKNNPSRHQDILSARKLLLNISRNEKSVAENRIDDTWSFIKMSIDEMKPEQAAGKIVPLNSHASIRKYTNYRSQYSKYDQLFRIAAILVFAVLLGVSASFLDRQDAELLTEIPLEYEEHLAPAGVKSNLTLWDGSKVILNSGSSIRYIKNFEPHQRAIELTGEAFFEVKKDPNRPFIVKTSHLSTRVLGTSFNIKSTETGSTEVSLLTGKVEVEVNSTRPQTVNLIPGEALSFMPKSQQIKKGSFDQDKVLAWTNKTIVFDQTPIYEIKRVLENWYGVEIQFNNQPANDLEITSRFQDQSLKDVLEGLSYSARFDFKIEDEKVVITFK